MEININSIIEFILVAAFCVVSLWGIGQMNSMFTPEPKEKK